jgi:hypothetical protein
LKGFYQFVIVLFTTNCDTNILLAFEGFLVTAVLDKDIVPLDKGNGQAGGGAGPYNFAEEVIGLGRNHPKIWDAAEFGRKSFALPLEFLAGTLIVGLVFAEDLHIEFGEGVDVPDGDVFLYVIYKVLVGRG